MKKKAIQIKDVQYYKWEFLRRWDRYKSDYKNRKGFSSDYWRKKYGIITPVDPKSNYGFLPKAYLVSDPAVVVVDCEDKALEYKDVLLETDLDVYLGEDNVDMTKVNTLTMKVNIRQNREKVEKEFKKALTDWRKACKVTQNNRAQNKWCRFS